LAILSAKSSRHRVGGVPVDYVEIRPAAAASVAVVPWN